MLIVMIAVEEVMVIVMGMVVVKMKVMKVIKPYESDNLLYNTLMTAPLVK